MNAALQIDALLQYGLIGFVLMLGLFLFFALKRELSLATKKYLSELKVLREQVKQVETRSLRFEEELLARTINSPERRTSFNQTHRAQALRLLRRGEDIGHVAAALGVPRAEIELLVRVQQLNAARLARRT